MINTSSAFVEIAIYVTPYLVQTYKLESDEIEYLIAESVKKHTL